MIEQHPKEEVFHVIKAIEANPTTTQRSISNNLGISLGKTNYILKALIKKGLVKASNFSRNPRKLKTINYILTKKGIEERISLTQHFLKRKEQEYNLLKTEWEKLTVAK